MDKVFEVNLLYDFYGSLLTQRQQKYIDLYYGNDYSLGEIAENFEVSRQAVHDTLKRAEQLLIGYECKLGLFEKFIEQRRQLNEMAILLNDNGELFSERLARAREILQELLDRG